MKVYLHGQEEWPVHEPHKEDYPYCGCEPFEVDEATVTRWRTAMDEYRKVQREMGNLIRDRDEEG